MLCFIHIHCDDLTLHTTSDFILCHWKILFLTTAEIKNNFSSSVRHEWSMKCTRDAFNLFINILLLLFPTSSSLFYVGDETRVAICEKKRARRKEKEKKFFFNCFFVPLCSCHKCALLSRLSTRGRFFSFLRKKGNEDMM